MSFPHRLRWHLKNPHQSLKRIGLLAKVRQLGWINSVKRAPVVKPGGPVVSLTTHNKRIYTVHLTIESIGRGSLLPSRLILWLDDKSLFDSLPPALRRLQDRGLEIKLSENYGPYTKFYPYVASLPEFHAPLITADDDVLYPPNWLQGLAAAYAQYPDFINCYRARLVSVDETGMDRYKNYHLLDTTAPSICHMGTGVSGIIYPPAFQKILKDAGTRFTDTCPKGDDLWLYLCALRSGYKVRQIRTQPLEFPGIPGTQDIALHLQNISHDDGNDRQIKATFTEADIAILRRALAEYVA